jgi:cytosine/adenosine deaminase-related metal-dependent hydrolase
VAIIHGNYLGASERRLLSEHRNQMSLVYCPRTHEYFGHAPYPLGEYLACGVNVAIGTDSRASSPSLEIGRDLLAAAKLHPDVPKSTLLAMVTLKAAEAIGAAEFFGSIRPGKCAKLLAIRVDPGVRDPHEALFAAFEAGQTCVPVS